MSFVDTSLTDGKVPKHSSDVLGFEDSPITVAATGEVTNASQPAFLAQADGTQTNIATGANVTMLFQTERYDQNADYAAATGIFTAPVTGVYHFDASLYLNSVDSATAYYMSIITSNVTLAFDCFDVTQMAGDMTPWTFAGSTDVDMDAGDTAKINLYQAAGTQQTDVGTDSHFSGHLVC